MVKFMILNYLKRFCSTCFGYSGLALGGLYLSIKNKISSNKDLSKEFNNYLGSEFSDSEIRER